MVWRVKKVVMLKTYAVVDLALDSRKVKASFDFTTKRIFFSETGARGLTAPRLTAAETAVLKPMVLNAVAVQRLTS
jgi:hypothetical protein